MTKKPKRTYGEGGIQERGENTYRLTYRINETRYFKTFYGTKEEAKKELRELLRSGDTGEHVAPAKVTVADLAKHWIEIGAPGRKKEKVGQRAIERYDQLMRTHVLPALGTIKLQALRDTHIDRLYLDLEGKISERTARHVHSVFTAFLSYAKRKKKVAVSPMESVSNVPPAGESDHGIALDDQQLAVLLRGFKGSVLFAFACTAAFTGARRNEILALRWRDLDVDAKTLRIERALETTKKFGVRFKGPKKDRHKRSITIDDDLLSVLIAEREKHLRMMAGVPAGADVDLSLVRLPAEALMFPNREAMASLDFTKPRHDRDTTKEFNRRARKILREARKVLGEKFWETEPPDQLGCFTLHWLRGTHETLLLDQGVPVHVVAKRCGHDPAVLLRNYAKRTKKADTSAASVIGGLSRSILGA